MKLHLNPFDHRNQQLNGLQGVHLVQAGLLPGARKTWATSTGGRLVLEDTFKV
jgi:hypothetical protein